MSKHLEDLLLLIDTERAQFMLEDLRCPEKRTPQLYNAIAKLLEQHKFTIGKAVPDAGILGDLASALPDGLIDSDHYSH